MKPLRTAACFPSGVFSYTSSLALALLLSACAHAPHSVVKAIPASEIKDPIWPKSITPSPLGIVRMTPRDSVTVSLTGSTLAPLDRILSFSVEPKDKVIAQAQPTSLQLVAREGADGLALATIKASTGGGTATETVTFPILVSALPIVEFVYTPQDGEKVENVTLAGAFNGWSGDKDKFEPQSNGSFRLEKAIPPGSWTYKFVVDGEWIADPSNPELDASGFGNSLLKVEGSATESFDFVALSAGMAGTGDQAGFQALLRSGEEFDNSTIRVLVNNRLLEADEYTADASSGTVALSVRPDAWLSENYAIVMGDTTTGRRGIAGGWFSYADAPRSPRDEIIYFTLTDRFRDGDKSLNHPATDPRVTPLANYAGGDWKGIREKIDDGYFDKLGISTLWLSPPLRNTPKVEKESVEPGNYYTSYHGYWPISSTETNPQFGTMEDLQKLVGDAHANGMGVLLDFVANHVHVDHPLYKEHPDWITDQMLPNGEKNLREFDAHPFTTWFDDFIPSLDYVSNPGVSEYMWDNAIYWMETTGADGFRQDAVKHIPEAFWAGLTDRLEEKYPDRIVYQVGETISGYETVARFVGPELMQGQFDFPGYFTARGVLAKGDGKMSDLAETFAGAERYYPASSMMSPLLGNHDMARFMAYADGDLPDGEDDKEIGRNNPPKVDSPKNYERLRLGFAWLLTIPGTPTLYYGDEIGMSGGGDPDNRRPMQWENWTSEQQENFDTFASLAKVRHDSIALRRGNVAVLFADDERLVYTRTSPEETVLVALSRQPTDDSITIVLPSYMGSAPTMKPLLAAPNGAVLVGNRLRITDRPWGYGAWKIEP